MKILNEKEVLNVTGGDLCACFKSPNFFWYATKSDCENSCCEINRDAGYLTCYESPKRGGGFITTNQQLHLCKEPKPSKIPNILISINGLSLVEPLQ